MVNLEVGRLGRQLEFQLPAELFTDALRHGNVVLALGAEAVHVYHGQLHIGVWREQFPDL